MRRLVAIVGFAILALVIAVPAIAADTAITHTGRVLIAIKGGVTVAAGEQADAVIVVDGTATIAGTVGTLTIVGGSADLEGARVETLVAIGGTAALGPGTVVLNDVLELNATIDRADGVEIGGGIRSLGVELAGLAWFLGTMTLLFWIGTGLATLLAGLALVALASRQLATTERILSTEPVKAFATGVVMLILPPLVGILLAVTIIGLPLALSLVVIVWPALAFVGYLVGAIWIGQRVLRSQAAAQPPRPYLATVVGLLISMVLGILPLVTAIISLFGLGAVTVAGWRTVRERSTPTMSVRPQSAPLAG